MIYYGKIGFGGLGLKCCHEGKMESWGFKPAYLIPEIKLVESLHNISYKTFHKFIEI